MTRQTELAAATADPINALILHALQIWGETVPVEHLRDLTARTGLSFSALRSRQKRLIRLLRAAGNPPAPLFAVGETVCLQDDPAVVGVVAAMTELTCQVRLTTDATEWLSVPFHQLQRVSPCESALGERDLSRGQRALRRVRRRREAERLASTSTF